MQSGGAVIAKRILIATLAALWAGIAQAQPESSGAEALAAIEARYLEPLSLSNAERAHLATLDVDALLAGLDLDPAILYWPPGRIGEAGADAPRPVVFTREGADVFVLDVRRGEEGLDQVRHGARLISVDGVDAHSLSSEALAALGRQRPGEGAVTVRINEVSPVEVELGEASGQNTSVAAGRFGEILYVRIWQFEAATIDQLQAAFEPAAPRGVILDLRANPGGIYDSAVLTAGAFLDGGDVVTVVGRNSGGPDVETALPGDLAGGAPLVVLVDAATAMGAEIVAGALQDRQRAIVLGQPTAGAGVLRTGTVLRRGRDGVLFIPTGLIFRPSGAPIQGRPLQPDVVVALHDTPAGFPPEYDGPLAGVRRRAGEDAQVSRALQLLRDR